MKFIYNNYIRGSGNGATWHVDIDPPSRPVKSYYNECCTAAEMIWTQKTGKLYITLSGGLDSEYALAVFRSLGMEIHPVIMRFTQGYNQHDIAHAFKYCNENNIDHTVIDLDFDKFVESGEMLSMATAGQCSFYEMPASVWLAKQLDGTVITGNDPPHMKRVNDKWYYDEEEYSHCQFTMWRQHGIEGTPFFLAYTAEQALSFLIEPTIVDLAHDRIPGKTGTNSSKVHVFNNGTGFNLENRQKYTGYEQIYNQTISKHPDMLQVLSYRDRWGGCSNHEYFDIVTKLDKFNQRPF
jgi:hypothetical protein